MAEILNRVAQSGIVSIDLGDFFPVQEIVTLDIKPWLFHGLILKEADFRQHLEEHNWEFYAGKNVCLICTADAVIPIWAYMLLSARLKPFANNIVFGTAETFLNMHYQEALKNINAEDYRDKRIVIKGCGDKPVPIHAYVEITRLLQPVAKSIMFGEPCSTVPVYKKPKIKENPA